jgi:hypothetical protein
VDAGRLAAGHTMMPERIGRHFFLALAGSPHGRPVLRRDNGVLDAFDFRLLNCAKSDLTEIHIALDCA